MPTTTPTRWLAQARVNTTDAPPPGAHISATNAQQNATVVSLTNGNYLVVWEDYSGTFDYGLEPAAIVGQIYSPFGTKVGGELGLSTIYNDLSQQMPAITAMPGGGFAVAQQTTDAATAGDLENIIVEIYDATGSYTRSEDFRQGFGGTPGINDITPTIAGYADGSYVVAFADDESGNYDIDAYVVSSTGTVGTPISIVGGAGDASLPDLAILTNQNFVVAYQQVNDIGFAIRTAAGGVVANGSVAAGASAETAPAIAALTGGGFVVAWTDSAGDGAGNSGIKFHVYNSAGTGGTTLSANTLTTGAQNSAAVTALADGGFVIAWRDDANSSIQAARFNASGSLIGTQFTLSNVADDSDPQLALLADGRFVGVYTVTNVASNSNVFQTIRDPRTSPINGTASDDIIASRNEGARVNGLGGADKLYGFGGNDTLDGGTGADQMKGGRGNDTYFVSEAGDQTTETTAGVDGGTDTVFSTVSRSLGANLENLRLQGTANLNGDGNELNNIITGTTGANLLQGLAGGDTLIGYDGADTLNGGEGNDTLTGGSQADVFRFASANAGADTITDFNKNADRFQLSGGTFTSMITAMDGDIILTHNGGTVRIDAPLHVLTLEQWNALVIPGGGAGGFNSVAAQDSYAASHFLAARLQLEMIHLAHGDYVFA